MRTCVPQQFPPRSDTLSPHSSDFLAPKKQGYTDFQYQYLVISWLYSDLLHLHEYDLDPSQTLAASTVTFHIPVFLPAACADTSHFFFGLESVRKISP